MFSDLGARGYASPSFLLNWIWQVVRTALQSTGRLGFTITVSEFRGRTIKGIKRKLWTCGNSVWKTSYMRQQLKR
jgi:hypothetical protein